jgi:hypothetical protein
MPTDVEYIASLPLEERQRIREDLLRTANLAVPAVQELLKACACAPPSRVAPKKREEPAEPWRRPSHVDPTPLGPVPGLRWMDQMMDAADRRDRAELIEKEAATHRIDQAIRSKAK